MTTPYHLAVRFVGSVKEQPGSASHPAISYWLALCTGHLDSADEIPWCSAFVHFIAWLLNLPRAKTLSARRWLTCGLPVELKDAIVGFDVVILSRGEGLQPNATVLNAPGHVGFYAGRENGQIKVIGGNQGNAVTEALFPVERVLGVRRLR